MVNQLWVSHLKCDGKTLTDFGIDVIVQIKIDSLQPNVMHTYLVSLYNIFTREKVWEMCECKIIVFYTFKYLINFEVRAAKL